MESKKILITGASGFIGACLARKLAKNNSVYLFLRDTSDLWRLKDMLKEFNIYNVDLTNREQTFECLKEIKPHYVYHLATYGAYSHQKDPKRMVDTNLFGTINLSDASMETNVSRFINISSSSEYGIKDSPMIEKDFAAPNNLYGITKNAATNYLTHLFREKNFSTTTFRIFAAYGYFDDKARLMPSVILSLLLNKSLHLSSPHSVRDFIFVEDIIEAFELASKSELAIGQILNLGNGKQHTIKDVVDLAKSLIDSSIQPQWGSLEKKQIEPKSWVADMNKTEKTLNWKPSFDLKKGLKKDIEWFSSNLDLYGGSL